MFILYTTLWVPSSCGLYLFSHTIVTQMRPFYHMIIVDLCWFTWYRAWVLAVLQVVVLELVVLWVWLPSMSACHSRSTECTTVLRSRQNHYGQSKGVVLISILFVLNSQSTAFDNLTVSVAVTAREQVSRKRKQWLQHAFYLWQVSWVFYPWLFLYACRALCAEVIT